MGGPRIPAPAPRGPRRGHGPGRESRGGEGDPDRPRAPHPGRRRAPERGGGGAVAPGWGGLRRGRHPSARGAGVDRRAGGRIPRPHRGGSGRAGAKRGGRRLGAPAGGRLSRAGGRALPAAPRGNAGDRRPPRRPHGRSRSPPDGGGGAAHDRAGPGGRRHRVPHGIARPRRDRLRRRGAGDGTLHRRARAARRRGGVCGMTEIRRETRETSVRASVAFGAGTAAIETPVPFLNHMLGTLAAYAGLDLSVQARGDLTHHIVEDVAITLGEAIRRLSPAACRRFAERTVAMDDALVQAVLDAGGRPYYRGPLPSRLYDHWMRSFCHAARFTLHLRVLRGRDHDHAVEAAFKALGFCLRDALAEGAGGAVFSNKGAVSLEAE